MLCVGLQKLRLHCPVLVDLRRKLHEVAIHVCSRLSAELCLGEHSLKRVAKLVESGFHLIECEKRWHILGGLGEIAHIVDYRALTHAVVVILTLELAHPSTLTLCCTREIVGHEHCHVIALGIFHVVNGNFGVILGSIGHLGECDAVEAVCHSENSLHHVLKLEVWANIVLAEVEFLLLHLLGIVIVVPGCNLEVATLLVHVSLHIGDFLLHLGYSRTPYLIEQILGILHFLCHHVVHLVGCKRLETEQFCLLGAKLKQAVDVL